MADESAMTMAERLKSRSGRELERIESEGRPTAPRAKKKKKKKKVKEAIGVGRDDSQSNAARLIARLQARAAATEDPAQRAELASRIEAIRATVTE